ncbi:hypothetical protein HII36_38120 [Nonomuraea sp. NN258]|uniref:hypothetical protein n=1 Tax=Nonomuraea antri TaxID=2730852 RepID=UPI001569905E|nr:hypothetical protein [Nonomuraea antri]NRQ37607.1 hypothetical protein [Nonomuraea antri]
MMILVFPAGAALLAAAPQDIGFAAEGVLYLLTFLACCVLGFAVRQVTKVVSSLLRVALVVIAFLALGTAAVLVLARVLIELGPF